MTRNATAAPATPATPAPSCVHRTVAIRKEANELRKTLKPLVEKRRRARINDSLNRLKALVLPLTGKDKLCYSKLEKADILQMTVRFLKDTQSISSEDSTVSFEEGYKACLQRVTALLPQTGLDAEKRQCVNAFIQRSVKASKPACENCCAQSSRFMSQIQEKLLNLKSSSSRNADKSNATLSRAQPSALTPDAQVWRPW